MKQNYIAILLIIISLFAFGQKPAGTVKYKVKHDWIKKINAVDYISKAQKEKYNYVWGKRSEYVRESMLVFDSCAMRYEEIEDENQNPGYSYRKSEYIIYRDLEKMQSYDLIRFLRKLYVVKDTVQYQSWKILNDVKEIAGHICMNASWNDTVKNNNVVAWFALDIPISLGPDYFGGLPGLILEIDINKGAYVVTADKIDLKTKVEPIEKPKHKKKVDYFTEAEYKQKIYEKVQECKKEEEPYFWTIRF